MKELVERGVEAGSNGLVTTREKQATTSDDKAPTKEDGATIARPNGLCRGSHVRQANTGVSGPQWVAV